MSTWARQARPLADWGGLSSDAWTALTAIGTLALAVVTLATLWTTIIQVRKERRRALEAEQLAEAYAIQVVGSETAVLVINHGKYTVTEIAARLKLRDGEFADFQSRARFLDPHGVDEKLIDGIPRTLAGTSATVHSDILAPWDAGLRFELDPAKAAGTLIGAYPVVWWTDRWKIRWEHSLGHVTKADGPD